MIIPKHLVKGSTIGVTALSDGITDKMKQKRFASGKTQLAKAGYEVVFTDNVFTSDSRGCSGPGEQRAQQFHKLIKDETVSAIVSAAGGDFLMEMLEYVDFDLIKENPKWIQGYSDNTGILYSITTKCDIATVYGFNFSDFGMNPWQLSVSRGLNILEGTETAQDSYDYYEKNRYEYVTGLEGYHPDEKVCWINASGEEEIEIEGRLLGGCFDVISFLVGTPYEDTTGFIEKYKDDGILWYLESFDMSDRDMIINLWKLKQMGYFIHATGFVFGRPLMFNSWFGLNYQEAVLSVIGDLNVPVIFDADIGHRGPQFSMINGAKAKVWSRDGKGQVTYL